MKGIDNNWRKLMQLKWLLWLLVLVATIASGLTVTAGLVPGSVGGTAKRTASAGSSGTGIVIGTTAVSGSCPNGYLVYNNNGVTGCKASSGAIAFPQVISGGVSGGVAYFTSTSSMAAGSSLRLNQLVIGGGAAASPTPLGTLGTTATVLHGNASGAPSFGAVNLSTDVTGVLPIVNNSQTGTNYTLVAGDNGKVLAIKNTSPVAVSLPQATGSFAAGFNFMCQNEGAGVVTLTPKTSTINGGSTLVLEKNHGVLIYSDGVNWRIAGTL
jgi:hypothetical protein